jgi:hypothetical protein
MSDPERRLGHTIAELHAIATRALANGDDYARVLLGEQLEDEEFSEPSDIAPGAESLTHLARSRSQRLVCAGAMVCWTEPSRSARTASRSTSSRSRTAKLSSVRAAS